MLGALPGDDPRSDSALPGDDHRTSGALGSSFSSHEPYQPLFEVKSTAGVVVEQNGVKTIRVVE
jgi:hypothetical protein